MVARANTVAFQGIEVVATGGHNMRTSEPPDLRIP